MTQTPELPIFVEPILKTNVGPCEGRWERCTVEACRQGEPLFGTLTRPSRDGMRRVKRCGDPVAIGRRNKRKGQAKQARAVTALGVPRSSIHPGHEEFLGGTIRVEVKAGGRMANPVWTRYQACEAQSEASRAIGDHRPFCAVFMPDGMSEGLAVIRLSQLHEFAEALLEQAS